MNLGPANAAAASISVECYNNDMTYCYGNSRGEVKLYRPKASDTRSIDEDVSVKL